MLGSYFRMYTLLLYVGLLSLYAYCTLWCNVCCRWTRKCAMSDEYLVHVCCDNGSVIVRYGWSHLADNVLKCTTSPEHTSADIDISTHKQGNCRPISILRGLWKITHESGIFAIIHRWTYSSTMITVINSKSVIKIFRLYLPNLSYTGSSKNPPLP